MLKKILGTCCVLSFLLVSSFFTFFGFLGLGFFFSYIGMTGWRGVESDDEGEGQSVCSESVLSHGDESCKA